MSFDPLSLLNSSNHASLYVELDRFPMPLGTYQSVGPFAVNGWELEGPDRDGNRAVLKGYSISLTYAVVEGMNPPVAWFLGQNRILFKLPVATDGQFLYYLLTFTNRTVLEKHEPEPAVPTDANNGSIECTSMSVNDNQTYFLWSIGVENAAETYMYL